MPQVDTLWRMSFGWLMVLGGAVSVGLVQPAVAAGERPNIVFVMADDLGYAHLGCYGQQQIATPHLDQMAAEGVRFTDFYAGCCVCAPSRSVLMTGLHGGHTPVRANTGGVALADEDVTVAELLQKSGYATGLFGKWGLGEHGTSGVPYRQGFDEFFGYLHQIHAHFHFPEYLWKMDQRYPLPGNRNGARGQYAQDEVLAQALDFIRRHREQSFFLYLPLAVPHYELLLPESSLSEYAGRFPETPFPGRGPNPGYPNGYAAQAMPRAATAGAIAHIDRGVGQLLATLRELNIDENTIVFFTSDNGATPGESDPEFFRACGPLRGVKGTLWEGGLRVPMIARWPGKVPAGVVHAAPCYFADVLPTLVELAGGQPPPEGDGVSLVELLHSPTGESLATDFNNRTLYWEFAPGAAARRGPWKAIRSRPQAAIELYNLHSDLGESANVAAQHPDVARELADFLSRSHVAPRPQIEPQKSAGRRFE